MRPDARVDDLYVAARLATEHHLGTCNGIQPGNRQQAAGVRKPDAVTERAHGDSTRAIKSTMTIATAPVSATLGQWWPWPLNTAVPHFAALSAPACFACSSWPCSASDGASFSSVSFAFAFSLPFGLAFSFSFSFSSSLGFCFLATAGASAWKMKICHHAPPATTEEHSQTKIDRTETEQYLLVVVAAFALSRCFGFRLGFRLGGRGGRGRGRAGT